MIKQKPISLKIDAQVLGELDSMLHAYPDSRVNRNKFINFAVRFVLDSIDFQIRCCPNVTPKLLTSIGSNDI